MTNQGNNRGGRHLKQNISSTNGSIANKSSSTTRKTIQGRKAKPKWNTKKKLGVILGTTAAIFALTIGMVVFATDWLRTARDEVPDVRLEPAGPREPVISLNPSTDSNEPTQSQEEAFLEPIDPSLRNTDKFTFLILGSDAAGGNTDVIMVGTLDIENNSFNIANIPRDTIANVSWNLRKVNSIHANMRIRHRGEEDHELRAMESTVDAFSDILGFKVDYWVVVNFRALTTLVDAIGGVDFNVPVTMYHSGVTLQRGQRRLTGAQALHVLRFRGFASADIGRINTTQNFLTAAAEQIIARRDSIRVSDLANVFLNNVITDIPLSNLVWFGERFLELDPENINFHTMPGQLDSIHGGSFVSILLDEWLELLNTYISPWDFEIAPENVSILTRGPDRRLFVTDGNWQGSSQWGAGTLGASNPNNIADWDAPRSGGTSGGGGTGGGTTGGTTANRPPQPNQPPRQNICIHCNNPEDACTVCFVCGSHNCGCDDTDDSGGGGGSGDGGGAGDGGDDGGAGDGGNVDDGGGAGGGDDTTDGGEE